MYIDGMNAKGIWDEQLQKSGQEWLWCMILQMFVIYFEIIRSLRNGICEEIVKDKDVCSET